MSIEIKQNKVVEAEYIPFKVDAYNRNPLTEALRPAMSVEDFTGHLYHDLKVDSTTQALDDFSRELVVEVLGTIYIPSPETYRLYKSIVKAILVGYLHRNPTKSDFDSLQNLVSTDKDFVMPDKINLSTCIANIGISGGGKTLSIDKCLSLIPQCISHTEYGGRPLKKTQIVYLKFEAPATKTKKGFILNFFYAVDELVGSRHYEEWKDVKVSNAVLILEAKKVAFNYMIGIAFIDEIQRCVAEHSDQEKNENRATLSFIDSFFNSVGIPMIVAGTYAVWPLYQTTMSTSRRLSSGRVFECLGIAELHSGGVDEDPYWVHFVSGYFKPFLLKKNFSFSKEVRALLHHYAVGIPALVVRLIKLCYEEAIYTELEEITLTLIHEVYRDQFFLLAPALEAYRNGEYGGYEDLIRPHMALLNPAKAGQDKSLELEQESVNIQQNLYALPQVDQGIVIDVPPAKATFIPADDLRNLSGLKREEIAAKLREL